MISLYFTLFIAGTLTILLPCILPLIPIVLGVSIAGRSKWRPLLTVLGMIVSFVGFTFLLTIVLNQFIEVAEYIRIATYYILLLFGLGFLTRNRKIQIPGAILGGLFFWEEGMIVTGISMVVGVILMEVGGTLATKIQQFGTNVQSKATDEFGADNPMTAFIIGLTMGMVWVPCAGPALGFALTLVREQPGLQAAALLATYAMGTAIPLLLIGYGGQAAVHSVRFLSRYSGKIKQVSGAILILTALAFQFYWFRTIEIWFLDHTPFGNIGVDLELRIFGNEGPSLPSDEGAFVPGETMRGEV